MRASDQEGSVPSKPRGDGRPCLVGRVGSLDAFWPLLEPVLARLQPRRLCEIGVDQGIFTERLLEWSRTQGCEYVGIDPAPDPSAAELIRRDQGTPSQLIVGRSLDVLPALAPCEAYFVDGDHNHHTVRHELSLIARAAATAGPVIFAHDVGWPFARRDMYHRPADIPPEVRQPFSEGLGVHLESNDLIAGGLRLPGRYAIADYAGGDGNGVLTAIEDFLSSDEGHGWQSVIVPLAYGLAILYRPAAIPGSCQEALHGLAAACGTMGSFLESHEANFLQLYLYAEATKAQLAFWTGDGQPGHAAYERSQRSYQELSDSYEGLSSAYRDLAAHSESLLRKYDQLMESYRVLERSTLLQGRSEP